MTMNPLCYCDGAECSYCFDDRMRANALNPNLKKGDTVGYINDIPVIFEGQWGDYIVIEDKKATNNATETTT